MGRTRTNRVELLYHFCPTLLNSTEHKSCKVYTDLSETKVHFSGQSFGNKRYRSATQHYWVKSHSIRKTSLQKKELIKKGPINESTSPYASPTTLASKKDVSIRLCMDNRQPNHNTITYKSRSTKSSHKVKDPSIPLDRRKLTANLSTVKPIEKTISPSPTNPDTQYFPTRTIFPTYVNFQSTYVKSKRRGMRRFSSTKQLNSENVF